MQNQIAISLTWYSGYSVNATSFPFVLPNWAGCLDEMIWLSMIWAIYFYAKWGFFSILPHRILQNHHIYQHMHSNLTQGLMQSLGSWLIFLYLPSANLGNGPILKALTGRFLNLFPMPFNLLFGWWQNLMEQELKSRSLNPPFSVQNPMGFHSILHTDCFISRFRGQEMIPLLVHRLGNPCKLHIVSPCLMANIRLMCHQKAGDYFRNK